MQNSTKNPPWARSNVNSNMSGMNPQIMDPNAMAMGQQGIMGFQQPFNPNMMQSQAGMAMPMAGQMQMNQMAQGQMYPGNVVAYPTPRAMNNSIYQGTQPNQTQGTPNEHRVFTGTVTKTHNDFGFVDQDVFYQTSVCAKGIIPKVNDRVLVEATFNPNMPFKWNATRVQVLPRGGPNNNKPNNNMPQKSSNYNAVPPPAAKKNNMPNRRDRSPRRDDRVNLQRKRSRSRSRSKSRDHRDSRRRDSPLRKRPTVHQPSPVKYMVRVPKMPLDISKLDVPSLSQRYNNLYIPSDFFSANVKWSETFPPQSPFSLSNSCSFHIMNKEAENPVANDAVLEPQDADYRFYAKVMLVSIPTLETLYQKCGLTKSDEKDKDKRGNSTKSPLHPTRLIKFLVGQKGKAGENFAIGGPWSPSLDGENPQTDPTVLVKTAIRTCKALTGIDLSACTQWYRMVEFYYWRESSSGKSRLETVVLFLPDVWSVESARSEWGDVVERYRAAADAATRRLEPQPPIEVANTSSNDDTITIDEDDEKCEPTHYSKLDVKTMKVDELRQELKARNASPKGLKSQLTTRLTKLLKDEENKDKGNDVMVVEDDEKPTEAAEEKKEVVNVDEDKPAETKVEPEKPKKTEKEIEEDKKKLEKEKQQIRTRYELPTNPHVIVHPSTTAKGGKFNCTLATLSLLLDYRVTDNKEHSFELFVFAELFNEMIMRDFGFYIYKTLYTVPEKIEEPKEKAAEKDKAEKKEEKSDKKDETKKDDRKDEKRDSRKRDRKDSHSDDERSSSPKNKSRGVDLPPDPYLLLSLVYFDTGRCNYIIKKDLQSLFMSLGLQLSRSQIRAILEKVCIKNNFDYKTLAQNIKDLATGTSNEALQDLPLETTLSPDPEVPAHVAELENTIAAGNRNLLPVFGKSSSQSSNAESTGDMEVPEGGMIIYKSRLIDVEATLQALSRSEKQRSKLEIALNEARSVARTMRIAAAQTQAASKSSLNQLSDLTEQLATAKGRIMSLTASSKIFHSALKSIQAKVEAVVNIKYEEDDDVVEVVNGTVKSEKKEADKKDTKNEVKDEKPKEKEVKDETPDTKDSKTETDKGKESTEQPKIETKTEDIKTDETTSDIMDLDDKE